MFCVVGHRGAMGLEPENTLRSFLHAAGGGVDEIELDLHLSADGHLVVMHDLTVDRTTDGTGPIAELTLAQIKQLDAGLGESVPTFDEVLDAVDLPIQAEVKAVDAAAATVDTIRRRGRLDQVQVTSFHDEAIVAARKVDPRVTTGLIASGASMDFLNRALVAGAALVCPGLANLRPEFVSNAHRSGLEVGAWLVNTPEQVLQAFRLEVDRVTSDYPTVLETAAGAIGDLRDGLDRLEATLSRTRVG